MPAVKISKKQITISLILIFFIGLILRLQYLDRVTFGYDQARDAFQAINIWRGDPIKIIGPTTDIKGLFHGSLYWYLISPFYHFFDGNPLPARILMIIMNLLNVVFIFHFAKKMFKNNFIAMISAFIFAVSYEAIQYGRWLSNPPPALLTIAVFFYGFWLILNNDSIGFALMILAWSLSINFQFFLVYHIVFLAIAFVYLYLRSKREFLQTVRTHYKYYLLSIFFFSPFILSEIKFRFQGLRAIINVIDTKSNANDPIIQKVPKFIYSLVQNISYNFTTHNLLLAKIIFILIIAWVFFANIKKYRFRKQLSFLFVWLISPVMIYPLEKNNSYFLNVGITYPLILIVSLGMHEIADKSKLLKYFIIAGLLITIFWVNHRLINLNGDKGDMLFSVQDKQILNDEYKVIDYIYKESKGKQFAINSVTNPLFINTTWSYVFNFYGKKKYGYMPTWLGYPQDGTFGSEVLYANMNQRKGSFIFLIIEPSPGIPENYTEAFKQYENIRSRLKEVKRIGNFIIEKRILINERNFSRDDLMTFVR